MVNQAVSLLAAEHMLTINDDSALATEVCCLESLIMGDTGS